MPKIPLVAQKAHVYAGKRRRPGDTYEARGVTDARLLVALGQAIEAPPQSKALEATDLDGAAGGQYARRDQQAEPTGKPAKKAAAKKSGSRGKGYHRRDQQAEPQGGVVAEPPAAPLPGEQADFE